MAVFEPELLRGEPAAPLGRDDERAHEDRAPVRAVRARVHPDAATRGSGDRARELEAAEPRVAGPVQAHGVRRPSSRAQQLAVDLDTGEVARESHHERVDALVGGEEV
jgi:hypothetical protein